jgi:hypothetical protein
MRELRLLADRGRTVVVVTHSVLHLDICDRVMVMCLGGRMGYFGPPDGVLEFFGSEDYADVFHKVTHDAQRWAQRFRNSDVYRKYIGELSLQLLSPDDIDVSDSMTIAIPTPRSADVAATAIEDASAAAGPEATVDSAADTAAVTTAAVDTTAVDVVAAPTDAPVAPAAAAPATATATGTATGSAQVIAKATARVPAAPAKPAGARKPAGESKDISMTYRALHPLAPLRAFVTLSLRLIAVIFSDRGYSYVLLGLPLALAVLSHAVPGDMGLSPDPKGYSLEAQRLLVVFIIGAAFMGVAIAIREIVNEQSIYRRERAIGLSPGAYLASKVLIFLIIDAVQCCLFVYLAMLGRPKPADALILGDPMIEIMIAVTLVALTSTALGLLASALVRTTEQTTPILVVSVMAQLVLSGGLFAIEGQQVLEYISWIDPSRWGFAAAASTTNLVNFPFPDTLWVHVASNWWKAIAIMGGQILILLGATRLALRRFEPGNG